MTCFFKDRRDWEHVLYHSVCFSAKSPNQRWPSSRFHTMPVAEVARRAAFHTSAWQNTPEPFITSM